MLSLLLVLLLLLLLAERLWANLRRPSGFPPGPTWLPVCGSYLEVDRLTKKLGSQQQAFAYLVEKYGSPLVGLRLGGELTVIASSKSVIREVLTRPEFEGRPKHYFVQLRSLNMRKGITMVDGPLWQEQRAFVMRHMRSLGFNGSIMQTLLKEELCTLLDDISASSGGPMQLKKLLAPSVLNVLLHFFTGCRFPRGDQQVQTLIQLIEERSRAVDMGGGKLSAMPWLRFIQPESTGYNAIIKFNEMATAYFMKLIEDHKATYIPGKKRNIIDAFLHEMKKAEKEENYNTTFTENQLLMLLVDAFIGGSEETSNTLRFAFLMMLQNPDIQERVYKEIEEAVGTDRLPTLEDKDRLVYSIAALMESQRLSHVLPVRGFRRVLKDTTLNGYKLPMDTVVLINLWSLHMDKEHWGDPEIYRPDRFLTETGQLREYDGFLPFGLGKRRCLAEHFAKSYLFQMFTGVLQKFQILPPDDTEVKYITFGGFNITPKPYDIIFKPRQHCNRTKI
uniref:Cytochrome P450 305M2 n=1 Tax=Locusta migratoria TaxID=7004 RepID=CP305_LOCMI|nr:cytochrome P450 [Locusta migratoria]